MTSVGRHWRRVNGSALAFFISATSRLLASTAYSKFRRRFLWFMALYSRRHRTQPMLEITRNTAVINLCTHEVKIYLQMCNITFKNDNYHVQSNLVISNSDNSNFRLYRGRTLVPAASHYKRQEKASDLSNTAISKSRLYRVHSGALTCPRRHLYRSETRPSFAAVATLATAISAATVGRLVKCDTKHLWMPNSVKS